MQAAEIYISMTCLTRPGKSVTTESCPCESENVTLLFNLILKSNIYTSIERMHLWLQINCMLKKWANASTNSFYCGQQHNVSFLIGAWEEGLWIPQIFVYCLMRDRTKPSIQIPTRHRASYSNSFILYRGNLGMETLLQMTMSCTSSLILNYLPGLAAEQFLWWEHGIATPAGLHVPFNTAGQSASWLTDEPPINQQTAHPAANQPAHLQPSCQLAGTATTL